MQKYVLGFIHDKAGNCLFVRKRRGASVLRGKLNGIGGNVEPNESPVDAIVREVNEETGIYQDRDNWTYHGTFGDNDRYEVYVFSTEMFNPEFPAQNDVGEEHLWCDWRERDDLASNLKWMMPLVLSDAWFKVTE